MGENQECGANLRMSGCTISATRSVPTPGSPEPTHSLCAISCAKNLAMTGRYVNRSDSPVRTLSDQVGERISAAMGGQPAAEVVPLKSGAR